MAPSESSLPGAPLTRARPPTSSMSPGDASRSCPATRLVAHLEGGGMHGIAARHEGAARVGAGTPVELARVSGDHADVARIAAEHVGGDLRERRVVALPLSGETGGDQHAPARLNADVSAFVRPDAGALHVARDADADIAPLAPRLGLPGAKRRVARALERHLEA